MDPHSYFVPVTSFQTVLELIRGSLVGASVYSFSPTMMQKEMKRAI